MKIRKAHVVAFLMLASALGGAAAVWEFYLADALHELAVHQKRQSALETKLAALQDKFSRKTPQYLIDQWNLANDPWNKGKDQRKGYFRLAVDAPEPVEYPEGERIPRFFYEREYPDREAAMVAKLVENNCVLMFPPPYFGAHDMESLPANPKEDKVVEWLGNFDRGAYVVGFLADAGAVTIDEIVPWPPSTNASGSLTTHTAGLHFTISTRDLLSLLERFRAAPQYYKVEAIWISNKTLRNPNANVSVQMILTQAIYTVREPGVAVASALGGLDGGFGTFGTRGLRGGRRRR